MLFIENNGDIVKHQLYSSIHNHVTSLCELDTLTAL